MYDVRAYFISNNEVSQNHKVMNLNRDKNFKLNMDKKKYKVKLDMETIDKEDALTLVITLPENG